MEFLKTFLLIALIFIPLERILTLRPEQKMLRRNWLNDLVFWVANSQIIGLSLASIVSLTVIGSGWLIGDSVHAAVASQPAWLQFIEALLLADLGFYLAHRAFHAFPWLWKFHAVHHSIEELDWLAAARVHPVDQIITKGVSFLPVFVLGFSDIVIGAFMTLYAWQSVLVHSNVKLKLGPLRWLLASPEFHHWHHSKDQQARDRNFAGQLPILDVVFGTLHMPAGERPTAYGLDKPMPQNYVLQLAYPFRDTANLDNPAESPSGAATPHAGAGAATNQVSA